MVKALHRAGIEVILDVVFNHTAEGDDDGPTLCFRGIDNATYYILDDDGSRYANYTGCGNTLNANHPIVRRMIVDSLRYWVERDARRRLPLRPGVDPVARRSRAVRCRNPPVLWDIESDPVLAGTKLIAEAWDAGRALPGRQLRRRQLEGVERPLPRRRPRLLPRATTARCVRMADRLRRQPGRLRPRGARGRAEHQFRHLPRRLHAQRSGLLQRQAQRGQRRGQPRRRRRQPAAGTAASKARPTIPAIERCATAR